MENASVTMELLTANMVAVVIRESEMRNVEMPLENAQSCTCIANECITTE